MLFSKNKRALEVLQNKQLQALKGLSVITVLEGNVPPDGKEHFGFKDGISQPLIKDSPQYKKLTAAGKVPTTIKTGEFILGYENEHDIHPFSPYDPKTKEDIGQNGSYLVIRQLEQNVGTFWKYLEDQTKSKAGQPDENEKIKLGAKFVGRWPSGAPLACAPDRDDTSMAGKNDFGFHKEDPFGQKCPFGSHIRRSNPRDAKEADPELAKKLVRRHAILRRGRTYGEKPETAMNTKDDGQKRGLQFICLNTSLERQFEFVQHTWDNNMKFGGLYDEKDPLIGDHNEGGNFTVQGTPVRKRVHNIPRFITTKGGAYFFLPSIRTLKRIAQ